MDHDTRRRPGLFPPEEQMPVLIGWCWFAAAVLIVSLVVHASTFLGIDPMAVWPGVMFIHLAIFPPFIAAIYYASRIGGAKQGRQDRVISSAPLWLRILAGVFFAYALVNFAIFLVLVEGGGPHEREGKYVLEEHGTVLRELSEAEYHQHRAYVVRGFSGHWMLFSSAALMGLVGAARLRGRSVEAPAPTSVSRAGRCIAPAAPVDVAAQVATGEDANRPPEPISVRAGVFALGVYVACLALILSGLPVLSVAAVPPVTTAMVLAMRRRRGFSHRAFESCIGCLALFPNAFIASLMGRLVVEFIYLALSVGLGSALSHEVAVTFPREGPAQLSDGELLDNRAWSALMVFVMFPLFVVGTIGLTYLAEHVGRLVEVRRRNQHAGSRL
jgi:hypothetical protein